MNKTTNVEIKLKQQFPLTIKRLGINGEGVGYFKRKVVFVPGALPGEEVVVEVTKVHPKFTEAAVKKIRKKSPQRVQAPCEVYETCGGCQLQHLSYEGQLDTKKDILVQALEKHTRFTIENLMIHPTIGMQNPWHYRNKSQFQLGVQKGKVIAGLYSLDSHQLINIPKCIVQHPLTDKVTNTVKDILNDLRVPIYNERNKKGIVRTIVTRIGMKTNQCQIVLVTAKKELPQKELIIERIKKQLPEVVSVMQNVNKKNTSIVFGEETVHLSGKEIIEEKLEEFTYELSARAFFQLNPEQTVKMYNEIKKAAALTGKEKVVDAYCGVGTIGLWLADSTEEIRGMDVIAEGIEDAKKNAKAFGSNNANYYVGKAENLMPQWVKEGWKPDVVIVDPPRSGCDEAFLKAILQVQPKTFVYGSCNPSTLAKDLQILSKKYQVEYIQPIDMFPQTAHVECVAKLTLRSI